MRWNDSSVIRLPTTLSRRLLTSLLLIKNIALSRPFVQSFHRFAQLLMDAVSKPKLPPMITAEVLPQADKSRPPTTRKARSRYGQATTEVSLALLCCLPTATIPMEQRLVLEAKAYASRHLLLSLAASRCRQLLQPPAREALSSLPSLTK